MNIIKVKFIGSNKEAQFENLTLNQVYLAKQGEERILTILDDSAMLINLLQDYFECPLGAP